MQSKHIIYCVIIIAFSTYFFYCINSTIKPFNEWPSIKYTTPDSGSYISVGKWLLNKADFNSVKHSVAIRPFLYPLIVAILDSIHPWAVIVFQFSLWELQIITVYFCGLLLSRSSLLSFMLSIFCTTLLSPIGISLHVLAETTASFLLVFSIFFAVLYKKKSRDIFILICLSALSLCSVIKPVYLYLFLASILLFFPILKKKCTSSVLLIIIALPVLFQITLMNYRFNIKKISAIDSFAVNNYFLSRLESRNLRKYDTGKSLSDIRVIRDKRRNVLSEMIDKHGYARSSLIVKNELFNSIEIYPVNTLKLFLDLIIENSKQPSYYLFSDNPVLAKRYFIISLWQSNAVRIINIISLVLFLYCLIIKIINIERVDIYVILALSITYISTGITFWQGDRFIIPVYFASAIFFLYNINNAITLYQQSEME